MPKFEITRPNGTVNYVVSDSIESVRRDLLNEHSDVREISPEEEAEIEGVAEVARELEAQGVTPEEAENDAPAIYAERHESDEAPWTDVNSTGAASETPSSESGGEGDPQ